MKEKLGKIFKKSVINTSEDKQLIFAMGIF